MCTCYQALPVVFFYCGLVNKMLWRDLGYMFGAITAILDRFVLCCCFHQ